MAQVNFYAGEGTNIVNTAGSGLSFFGDGFGRSIPVSSFNSRTFITDSTGTEQGPEVDNIKWAHPSSGVLGQAGTPISLLAIPNYLSTLNIRFTHGSPVQLQNARIYGYDRVNKLNNPSGVNLYAADIIHPGLTQAITGSGSSSWTLVRGSGYLSLHAGPGTSGLSPNGPATSSVQHDYYIALTASPTSVGAKEFGLWYECEFI